MKKASMPTFTKQAEADQHTQGAGFQLAEIWKTGRNKGCVEAPETEKAAGING